MSRQRLVSLGSAEFELWQQRESPVGSRRYIDIGVLKLVMAERLTERQREYITDYYFDRMNIYEIAKARGIAPSTVSRTLKRARGRIYEALKYSIKR